jgi:hypothetical protein
MHIAEYASSADDETTMAERHGTANSVAVSSAMGSPGIRVAHLRVGHPSLIQDQTCVGHRPALELRGAQRPASSGGLGAEPQQQRVLFVLHGLPAAARTGGTTAMMARTKLAIGAAVSWAGARRLRHGGRASWRDAGKPCPAAVHQQVRQTGSLSDAVKDIVKTKRLLD